MENCNHEFVLYSIEPMQGGFFLVPYMQTNKRKCFSARCTKCGKQYSLALDETRQARIKRDKQSYYHCHWRQIDNAKFEKYLREHPEVLED